MQNDRIVSPTRQKLDFGGLRLSRHPESSSGATPAGGKMRFPSVSFLLAILLSAAIAYTSFPASAAVIATRDDIIREAQSVADAQLRDLGGKSMIDWTWGVMAAGYTEFSHVAPNGSVYAKAMTRIADQYKWMLLNHSKVPYHADDFCIAQAYLDLYANLPHPEHVAPTKSRMDSLAKHLSDTRNTSRLTFYWCDALFMAPPAMARMSAISKDRKYLDATDGEFWRTTELLYDKKEHLFYRDTPQMKRKAPNGKGVFWSRGNGWVLGGLARLMQAMPADYPTRPKYEVLFKEMSARLITLQANDGTWRSSLLDPEQFPGSETSGTALFTYGIAWGINAGLLDRATYKPVVEKAWAAMLKARRPDGLPGYSQKVAASPGAAKPDSTAVYATGAYLLAASQLAKLAPLSLPESVKLVDPSGTGLKVADAPAPVEPDPGDKAFARYVPERMDDIAWENDRIAHRIYGPALQNNPKEHSGSGIDVWAKSVRELVINRWYKENSYHKDHGTGLDFYEVGTSRGDGGLGVWADGKLFVSKCWADHKILDLGPDECGFTISYDPWDANGSKVWETRTMTLKAGSNLTRVESTLYSDTPGEIVIGIGLSNERPGKDGRLFKDKDAGILSFWQPPEKSGTIGVGVLVDPKSIVDFTQDSKNNLVLVKQTVGKPFVYYTGACWNKGLDFHSSDEWEKYLKNFKRE